MFKKIVTSTLAAALSLGAFVAFGANAQAAKTYVVKDLLSWDITDDEIPDEYGVRKELIPTAYGEELFSVTVSNDTPVAGTVITITKPNKQDNNEDWSLYISEDGEEVVLKESDATLNENAYSMSYTLKKDNDTVSIWWINPTDYVTYEWSKNGEFIGGGASSYWAIPTVDVTATPAPAAPVVTPAPAAPAAPATPTVPAIGQTYTVKKGDSLFKIAKKAYNNGNLYMHIFNANKNIIKKPSLIKPGQVLTIPTI